MADDLLRAVLAKCDELERYAPDERDDYDAGMRQAVREIREAVGKPPAPARRRASVELRQWVEALRVRSHA